MKFTRLINLFLLLGLAAFLAVWSLSGLTSSALIENEGWMTTDEIVFGELIDFERDSVARINGRDAIMVFAGSEAILEWDQFESRLVVYLERGGVLASTYAGDVMIDIRADGFANVRSYKNIVYAELSDDQNEVNVYALDHPAKISFIQNGQELSSLYLPTDYRMRVPKVKVTETISKLRLAKLSKEFPHYDIDEDDLTELVLQELEDVKSVYTDVALSYLASVQSAGELGPETEGFAGILNDLYGDFREAITVMPHARERLHEDSEEATLLYAVTNYLFGDSAMGDYWLAQWRNLDHDSEYLEDFFTSLYFVLPGGDLYNVKSAVSNVLFANGDAIYSLQNKYREVETLISQADKVNAQEAYLEYKSDFEKALKSGAFDGEEWLSVISHEYMLVELLLRSSSVFYDTASIGLLSDLEEKILQLAGSSANLDEERQAFVQSKLRFLENLFEFVVQDKVTVEEASELAEALIYEAETYLEEVGTSTAVLKYFEGKLEGYGLAVAFMNSPEFASYSSFDEGLADYSLKVADLEDLNSYIQSVRSGNDEESVGITLEEALDEVGTALLRAGIQYNDLVSLEDASHRLFEVKDARTAGYGFQANYDRETEILYDVVVGDLRFSTGLLLENAKEVILSLMEGDVDDGEEELEEELATSSSSGSLLASVALENVQDKFGEVGLDAADFVFSVKNLDENTFNFEGTMLDDKLPVSGVYDSDTGQVAEFVWEFNGEELALPATSLANLEAALAATYTVLQPGDSEATE